MNNPKRYNMYLLAVKKVHESRLFTSPHIKYVFTKNDRKPQFLIGISDEIDEINCIYELCSDNRLIYLEDLEYADSIFSDITEDCEEGFILSVMSEGYDPVFIDIQTHVCLWDYIDYYITEIEKEKETIIKYLEFCYSTGISSYLLSEYSDILINNLYSIYFKDPFMILIHKTHDNFLVSNSYEDGYINSLFKRQDQEKRHE